MAALRSFLQQLTAAAYSSPEFEEGREFLATHKNVLPDLLTGLFKVGAIEGKRVPRHPAECGLCGQAFDADMIYVKGRAYWGPEPKRRRGSEPVWMCLDCHLQCGEPIGPDAALYYIDDRGHSWWIAGQHRFAHASVDGGRCLL